MTQACFKSASFHSVPAGGQQCQRLPNTAQTVGPKHQKKLSIEMQEE